MAPTNLYQYYTGQGKALPSVQQNAQQYASYGLGDANSFTGSAQQNTALLGRLTSGQPSGSQGGAPSGGGYSQTPSGQPQAISNDPGYGEETALANKQASDLNAFTQQQQGTISGAYQNASQQTGLQGYADTMNQIRNSLNAQQNAAAEAPVNAINGASGTFAGASNVQAQQAKNSVIPDELVARLSANLTPAENAYQSAQAATGHISDNIVSGAQLAQQGFTSGQQTQLKALQDKVSRGQALSDMEFQRESQLSNAKIQANAQIESARIGASATSAAAITAANASTTNNSNTNQANLNALAVAQGYPNFAAWQEALGKNGGGNITNQIINEVKGKNSNQSLDLQGSMSQLQGSGTAPINNNSNQIDRNWQNKNSINVIR